MTFYNYNNKVLNQHIERYNNVIAEWQEVEFPQIIKTTYSFDDGSCDIQLHLSKNIDKSFITAIMLVLFKDYLSAAPSYLDEILGMCWLVDQDKIEFWYGRLENLNIDTYLSDPDCE